MSKILVIVGMAGAGKSSCVDYIAAKDIPKVYFGGVIVDETKRRFGEVTQEKERLVREELRAKEGKGAVAARIIPQIKELLKTHNHVIADGLYSWTEYRIFKDTFGDDALVIAVTAPRATRHARLLHRPVRPLTTEEAQTRDYAEIEFLEKGGPIANADYTINNDGSTETLFKDLEAVLQKAGFYSS
jgi:dephospho-CoA kinase